MDSPKIVENLFYGITVSSSLVFTMFTLDHLYLYLCCEIRLQFRFWIALLLHDQELEGEGKDSVASNQHFFFT